MTRDGRRPATTRSHRFQLALVHRAGQDPPYPPGSPSPGPGPTGPGPTGPGRGYSASFMLLDETLGDGDPILLPPKPPHQPDPNPTDPRLPGDPWDDGRGPNAARPPGPRPEPTRPADTRPPRDPVTPPPPEPEPDPKSMALLLLPLLPLLFLVGLAMAGRHRAADQPAERPDEHPDRLGAHERSAFRRDQIPADQLTRRDTPKDQR